MQLQKVRSQARRILFINLSLNVGQSPTQFRSQWRRVYIWIISLYKISVVYSFGPHFSDHFKETHLYARKQASNLKIKFHPQLKEISTEVSFSAVTLKFSLELQRIPKNTQSQGYVLCRCAVLSNFQRSYNRAFVQ